MDHLQSTSHNNSEVDIIRNLTLRAEAEAIPRAQVTARVMQTIAAHTQNMEMEPSLLAFAAGLSAASIAAGVLLVYSWEALNNPLVEIFVSLQGVMP